MNLFLLLAALVVVSPVAAAAKLAISVVDGVAPADSTNTIIIRDFSTLSH